jgi:hypothetical protein
LSRSVTPDDLSLYITHFNESFICYNSFTGGSADQFGDVDLLLRDSSALQNAVVAVSALDVEKRGGRHQKSSESTSLKYYRRGIASVQADLLKSDLRDNTSVLWSTIFLGLFELMFDATGEGWIKHFLHGTSALLQYRGPAAHLSSAGRRFFLTIRVFEISRALIYSSETFLAQEEWRSLPEKLWSGDQAKDWHPKEALFDLMTTCSTLGVQAMNAIRNMTDCAEISNEIVLRELAADGFLLRSELSAWRTSSSEWSLCFQSRFPQEQIKLALAYYNAISIFLSGIFDYHSHWRDHGISTATLSGSEIQAHVSAILEVVGLGLKEGSLAGILFFFPLRVAGARARTSKQKLEIARLLHLISARGFVVAQAFVMDLNELWNSKPAEQ